MAPSPSVSVTETMSRLSSKSGVLSTMAIDRASGSLIAFEGTSSWLVTNTNVKTAATSTSTDTMSTPQQPANSSASTTSIHQPAAVSATGSSAEDEKVNEFVKMIWKYVKSSEQMIQGMDEEEDLKLLRLRTKKHELVIVPDPKFIFVVVHDVKSS